MGSDPQPHDAEPVRVERLDLAGLDRARAGALRAHLDPDERARAAALRDPAAAARAALARGFLREVLGRAAGRDPAGLVFAPGPHGKPGLPGAGLAFNLSRAQGLVLVAWTRAPAGALELGLDVVRLDPDLGPRELAAALSADERRALETLPGSERGAAALRAFARKEAALKALGVGLGGPLDPTHLTLPAGEPERWASRPLPASPGEGRLWMCDLPAPPRPWAGHFAALALHGPAAGPRAVANPEGLSPGELGPAP